MSDTEVKKKRTRKKVAVICDDAEASASESSALLISALDLPPIDKHPEASKSCPMCEAGIPTKVHGPFHTPEMNSKHTYPVHTKSTSFIETDDNEIRSQVDIPAQEGSQSPEEYRAMVIEVLQKNPRYSNYLLAEKIADLIIEGKISMGPNGPMLNGKPLKKRVKKGYHVPITREQKAERSNKNKLAKKSRKKNRR